MIAAAVELVEGSVSGVAEEKSSWSLRLSSEKKLKNWFDFYY